MKPKYFILRNKQEADEFREYAMKDGDTFAEKMQMPEILSWKRVKCEMKLWKREKRRFIVSYSDPETNIPKFYNAHPSWVQYTQYYDNSSDSYE